MSGNTDLKGAVIASTQKAIDDGKNSLTTGSLTQSGLQNKDTYHASGFAVSASVSSKIGDQTNAGKDSHLSDAANQRNASAANSKDTPGASAGIGSQSGSQNSSTLSGISAGSITITNDAKQLELTGKDSKTTIAGLATGITTDTNTSGALTKAWNSQQLQKQIDAQISITQTFSQLAPKAVADYANQQAANLKAQAEQAAQENDPSKAAELQAEAKKWDEGGAYRIALHSVTGALSGGLTGAAGAATAASAAPLLDSLQAATERALTEQGLGSSAVKAIAQGIAEVTAIGLGAAVGGINGAATSLVVDTNNRQLHIANYDRLKDTCRNNNSTECQTINRIGGVRSGTPVADPQIPASLVVANYDSNNNIVSYVLIDRLTNAPTLILEPLEYTAYRNAPPGTQALTKLAPQYTLDFASAGLYALAGDNSRATEHVIAGVTSRDYLRDVALGVVGAAVSAVGGVRPGAVGASGGLAAGDAAVAAPRVSNGIVLDSRLPDPVAGLEYTPKTLNSPNPNIANSQVNGYVGELKLANEVANLPNQIVVRYGDAIGTHGADIVSVNSVTGEVTLWDNKFFSNTRNVPPSTTFAPQSSALDGTLTNARKAIDSSNLSPVIKQQAIQNLEKRNFTTNTVGLGAGKNSTIVRFCSGNPC